MSEEVNAFTVDEDEDMDALLEAAAASGSAAVDELDFEADKESPKPEVNRDLEQALLSLEDEEKEPPVVEKVVSEPKPEVKQAVSVEVSEPVEQPRRIVRETVEAQIANAKAVIATVDAFRKLSPAIQNVVSQLIFQDDDYTNEEAALAVRAIHADEMTFATMAALKEANDLSEVDCAFYVLELESDLRNNLGSLVAAFTGEDLPEDKNNISFSKALVKAIAKLDPDSLSYVSAAESVLRAAKQS